MNKEDRPFIFFVIMVCLTILIIKGLNVFSDYQKTKFEIQQPRYFIELENDLYELKEIKQ